MFLVLRWLSVASLFACARFAVSESCDGVLSSSREICCARSCGGCGGAKCDRNPGGYFACCEGGVKSSGRKCSERKSPCVMSSGDGGVRIEGGGSARRKAVVGAHAGPPVPDLFDRERKFGVRFDSVLLYMPVEYLKFSYLKKYLDAGKDVQLVMEFKESHPNLRAIGDGRYDDKLRDFARAAERDGRKIYVRPLHEFNGDW